MEKKCVCCNKIFFTKRKQTKLCSFKCNGLMIKGRIAWNKGTKGICKPNSGSFKKGQKIRLNCKHTKKAKKKMSLAKYKGENISYSGKHIWLKRVYGNPKKCNICNEKGKTKNNKWTIQWSNKDHKYKRNFEDYMSLCKKCHLKYDMKMGFIKRDLLGHFYKG